PSLKGVMAFEDSGKTPLDSLVSTELALPNDDTAPSELLELPLNHSVSLPISNKLFRPVCGIARRQGAIPATIVSMPETAVHKNQRPVPFEDDVWFAG